MNIQWQERIALLRFQKLFVCLFSKLTQMEKEEKEEKEKEEEEEEKTNSCYYTKHCPGTMLSNTQI